MVHQKLLLFFPLLANLAVPFVFSWKADVTGGGTQIILVQNYLLMAAASSFRLPIGGGLQNILPPKKILAAAANETIRVAQHS